VSDLDFHEVEIGKLSEFTFIVENISNVIGEDIIISSDYISKDPIFSTIDGFNFPITIKSGGFFVFKVGFQPVSDQPYSDTIIFKSNAKNSLNGDNKCILNGLGIKSDFADMKFDWGRRKVNGGYLSNFVLKNIGLADVEVTGILSAVGDTNIFSIYNLSLIKKKLFRKNDSFYVVITYQPKEIGYHKVEYILSTNKKYLTFKISLFGTSVQSKLFTQNFDFGLIEYGNYIKKTKIPFYIEINEFSDSLTISDIQIESDSNKLGKDYSISNKQSINFPFTFKLGSQDTLWLDIEFTPKDSGFRKAIIKPIILFDSDNNSNVECKLEGRVEKTFLIGSGDSINNLCYPDSAILEAKITNTSRTFPIEISNLRLIGELDKFQILNIKPFENFSINPNETKIIRVKYKNKIDGLFKTALQITNSSSENDKLFVNIEGGSVNVNSKLNVTINKFSKSLLLNLLDSFNLNVSLSNSFYPFKINQGILTIYYDSTSSIFLNTFSYDPDKISLSIISNETNPGKIVMLINFLNDDFDVNNLLHLNFSIPFTKSRISKFSIKLEIPDYDCVDVENDSVFVLINEICNNELFDKNNFMICNPYPNPFKSNTILKYTIGFDCNVKIDIVDKLGNHIIPVAKEFKQKGIYEKEISFEGLPNGSYFLRIWVGDLYKNFLISLIK
jgi:hypothetical protein